MDIEKHAQMMRWLTRPRSQVPGPRNMNQGGRIGFHRGKSANKFESWLKNQPEGTEFRTAQEVFEKAGEKSHGANQKIWNKYKDKFKITSGSRTGGNIALKEEAIKNHLDTLDPTVKLNVEQTVKTINKNLPKTEQISESLLYSRLKNPDFNTNNIKPRLWSDVAGKLSDEAQQAIKDSFDDVIKEWDFKNNKYGIPAGGREDSKALYEQIRRFADTPAEWKYAYNLGSPDGWLLSQMDRAGYQPITEIIKGKEKIIGHIDPDGNKWVSADKWKSKHNASVIKSSHPDYKATKKLVDITNKTRTLPNQAIQDILTKGGVPIDSRLQLNHLLNYLIDEKGVDVTRSALEKHHVRGVKHSPTKDIQLVTRIANQKANKIRNEIQSKVFDRIDVDERLKKLGITLDVDGARYGGKGFGSFKEVEGFVEKGLKGFDETKFKGLKEALVRSGIPCKKGAGGQCDSIMDYQKGYNQLVKEGAEGSKAAITKLGKFTKGMRALTGAAKWTGYGLLAEAGFMVPFAIGDYAAGKSWKRILGNATDYGFGPILGQSEQEEFEAALPKGSAAVQRRNIMELGERLYGMEQQKVNPGYGRIGYREKAPIQRQKVYDDILDEYTLNMQPFIRPTPHTEQGQFYDQGLMDKAEQQDIATMKKIAAADQKRIDERTERGIIANQNWQSQIAPRYAQGGIASLKKKW